MEDEEKIKQTYLQFQLLQQQIEQLSANLEFLNEQNTELEISRKAVEELGKTSLNKEVLAPIANGIFLKAELKDNQKLLVNVGSNVTVERTIPEVAKLLEEQLQEVQKRTIETDLLLRELSEQALKMYQEVENVQQAER